MSGFALGGEFLTFLTAVFVLVGVLVNLVVSLRNARHLQTMNVNFDGKVDRLLELTAEVAEARGVAIEREKRDSADAQREAAVASTRDSQQVAP